VEDGKHLGKLFSDRFSFICEITHGIDIFEQHILSSPLHVLEKGSNQIPTQNKRTHRTQKNNQLLEVGRGAMKEIVVAR
jgi:hypothetical protein